MLPQIAGMIEAIGLQISAGDRTFAKTDFGQPGPGQDIGGDILDRAIGDLVNEADIPVFAGGTRAITSRRVISGSTMASRPRRT
jgi:hypothetical protein